MARSSKKGPFVDVSLEKKILVGLLLSSSQNCYQFYYFDLAPDHQFLFDYLLNKVSVLETFRQISLDRLQC